MAQTIKLKRSAVAGRIPNVSDLELGEIAINTYDGKMYIKRSVNGEESISEIGQDASLGAVFTNYTFTATANQTVFTGNDNSGIVLNVVDEFSNVFMNGILLDPEIDFTISPGGLTLTLTEPAEADDILQINSFDQAIFNGTLNVDALALTGMVGEMVWNSDEETIDVPLNDNVTLQLGQEFVFRGKATEAISNGDVVMFAGAQGGHLLIAKANMAAVGFAPEHVIGIATQDFNVNDFGFVTELGKVRGLDTSSYSEGAILYLDPITAGGLTATKPTPPNHAIQMCAVVRSHGTQGTLLVRPTHMADTDEVAEGSSNLYFTVARAIAAIKADGAWNASDWDTAFGWGNHATEGYLTSVAFNDLTSTPTTISGYGITDAFDGAYSSLTGKPTLFSGSYTDLTNKPTIPTVPTTVSSFTNDSGYITDYTVTQGDVTAHQAALSITESQISDLDNYLTSETNTVLQIVGNTLRYTDETGTTTDIDLSLYLDDTNLSRLTSGSLDANGTATFTRDDNSTFTVDFSQFFDDTNLARITSAGFNTANGVLTLTRDDATTITADLDGRYLTSYTESDTLQSVTNRGATTTNKLEINTAGTQQLVLGTTNSSFDGAGNIEFRKQDDTLTGRLSMSYSSSFKFLELYTNFVSDASEVRKLRLYVGGDLKLTKGSNEYKVWDASDFSSTKISNWNTAYGWGDHSLAGYSTTDTNTTYTAGSGLSLTGTQFKIGWSATDTFTGTYPLVWRASDAPYTSSWLNVNGATDTLHSVNLAASGTVTASGGNSNNWNTAYGWGDHSTQSYATQTYVNNAVSNLVDSAPATLDTLNELAAALGDDANFAQTTATALGNKANLSGATFTGNVTIEDSVLEVGDKSADNYVEIRQYDGATDFGFTFQHSNASLFRNLQGSTNQILALGDVDPTADTTLLGVSILQGGSYYKRLNLLGNGTMYIGSGTDRVFADNYHPNADKWTTARTNTVTLSGDVTGSGSASVDGTGNWTVSIPAVVANDSHSHSNYMLRGNDSKIVRGLLGQECSMMTTTLTLTNGLQLVRTQ